MFGSTVLDVAIGMVFVYLLMSLLCSAVNEYIEAHLNYRSKNLWKGIQLLLNGVIAEGQKQPNLTATLPAKVTSPPAAAPAAAPPAATGNLDLASMLYQHGLVRALYQHEEKLPSYIPSRTFALALWNLASEATGTDNRDLNQIKDVIHHYIPNRQLSQALVTMIDEAKGDFDRAVKNVEDWYDGAMDRVSGWYKRRVQWILLGIGFAAAILINADSVNIAKTLIQDKALRDTIVAQAAKEQPPAPGTGGQQEVKDAYARISGLGLPLGWVRNTPATANDLRRVPNTPGDVILKIFGLFLTGLAISQGAPFWFDVLNKFMVIRSTVKPKEKSPDEPSKD
ncbi:MAG: hypothetical protein ACJ741_19540 [Pyrinomonadaceae bacterium]